MTHRGFSQRTARRGRRRLCGALCVVAGVLGWMPPADVWSQPPTSRDPTQLRAGLFLYASPRIGDPRFAQTVILVLRHDADGSVGVVINQPSDVTLRRALPNVPEARRSETQVYWGGPVQPEGFLVLLRDPGSSRQAQRILNGVYLSTDLEDLRGVLAEARPDRAVRVYSGYAGWSRGQLAQEVRLGQWLLDEGDALSVFAADPTPLWDKVHAIINRREARRDTPQGNAGGEAANAPASRSR